MTWLQSFLGKNLTMILSRLFLRRWQVPISCEGISQPTLLDTSSTLESRSLLETSQGMPTAFKHSPLENWAFSQRCVSISTILLLRSALTFLTTLLSDSSLTKFSLILRISSRASVFGMLYASTLFWRDKAIPITSLFDN